MSELNDWEVDTRGWTNILTMQTILILDGTTWRTFPEVVVQADISVSMPTSSGWQGLRSRGGQYINTTPVLCWDNVVDVGSA